MATLTNCAKHSRFLKSGKGSDCANQDTTSVGAKPATGGKLWADLSTRSISMICESDCHCEPQKKSQDFGDKALQCRIAMSGCDENRQRFAVSSCDFWAKTHFSAQIASDLALVMPNCQRSVTAIFGAL